MARARLSYLAPDVTTGIVDGSIGGAAKDGPPIRARLPLDWDEQCAMPMPA